MRTTLDLDDKLLEAIAARHPGRTKTDLVEDALRRYLGNEATAAIRRLAGHLAIDDASVDLRQQDRR
ncbi:MAG: type II toxin-antitoxin system VapB family antitoxin [Acidimicrobiales bacterium]